MAARETSCDLSRMAQRGGREVTIDIQLWLWYLHHGQRNVADAMRRAHNRSIINPRQIVTGGWGNFELGEGDKKAVRIQE